MRVWLCLLGLGISCHCQYDDANVVRVIDLRTAYRKYLPEELQDVPEPQSEESRSVNLTAVQIEKNKTFDGDWSAQRERGEFQEDSDMSESGRRWLKRIHNRGKDSYSFECNSSEYREFEASVERKWALEANNSDVFEDDTSHLWNKYGANKTAPPNFPLAYSPRFMNRAYRRYSLSFHNITLPTTQHWLNLPLTGDQGVLYDEAMSRLRKFKVNKNDPKRVAAINRFIEDEMKGKNLSRMKDIVRHFIAFKRKIGVKLNFTIPPISISKELENMKVPDTNEILEKYQKEEGEDYPTDDPDFEKIWNDRPKDSEEEQEAIVTLARQTRKEAHTTEGPSTTVKSIFELILNQKPPVFSGRVKPSSNEMRKSNVREELHETSTENPETFQGTLSTPHIKVGSTHPASNSTITNHPAAKFLHKHKNKFLIGGIACLVAAKILG